MDMNINDILADQMADQVLAAMRDGEPIPEDVSPIVALKIVNPSTYTEPMRSIMTEWLKTLEERYGVARTYK